MHCFETSLGELQLYCAYENMDNILMLAEIEAKLHSEQMLIVIKGIEVTFHFNHFLFQAIMKITHVIFDMDGLLIDTEVVFSKVNQYLLSKYDKEFTSHLRGLVTGMPKKAAVTYILEHVCFFLYSVIIAMQCFMQ